MSTTNEITVRHYTTTELSALYGVHARTFKRWLRPHASVIGEKSGKYFTILQVKLIFEKLGVPA
jgi:hypothetical protein